MQFASSQHLYTTACGWMIYPITAADVNDYSANELGTRLREDGMEYFSNVFIPEKPLAGKHGIPVGGCGRRVPESPGTRDGEVPSGMEKLTFRITGVAYRALPETDIPQRKAAKRWSSCAVVGISGSLLSSERGAEIDAHDMVRCYDPCPCCPMLPEPIQPCC